jgi:carbonic anhydrase
MRSRRFLAALAIAGLAALSVPSFAEEHHASSVTPQQGLERLKKGNADFLAAKPRSQNLLAQVKETAPGQSPWAAILSCMDSRAPVELLFQQGIGDLFSLRVAGNVIDTDDLAGFEYAIKVVGVKLIVVMGHTECGAVKGAIDDVKLGNLTELLAKIKPAVTASGPGGSKDSAYVDKVAEANVRQSMKEIREKSPVIKEMIASGQAGLVGAMYDVRTGKVTFMAD